MLVIKKLNNENHFPMLAINKLINENLFSNARESRNLIAKTCHATNCFRSVLHSKYYGSSCQRRMKRQVLNLELKLIQFSILFNKNDVTDVSIV